MMMLLSGTHTHTFCLRSPLFYTYYDGDVIVLCLCVCEREKEFREKMRKYD